MADSSIKKYQHVQPENTSETFAIKRMEQVSQAHAGVTDEPHRHDYFIVLLVNYAKGKHHIDFSEFELSSNQVYFISPGQVHQIIEERPSEGFVMTFSPQFLIESGIDSWFIEDLHLFQDYGYTPPLEPTPEGLEKLNALAKEIETYLNSDQSFKYQAVGALLKLFLIQCHNSCTKEPLNHPQQTQAALTLLRNFKTLLNQHFTAWHKVSEYANALFVTPDHLNSSIKSLTGKSAKEHIQSRIIIAAKRLLLYSGSSTKEIAFQLGFSEPANFSQFFKKCTGMSPTTFLKST